MQNKFLAVCAVALIFANPGIVQAQADGADAPYFDVTSKNAWSDFTGKFVTSTLDAMAAQASMLTAVGLTEQAATVTAQAKELSRGSPAGVIERVMAARAAGALALNAKLGGLVLDAAKKPQFGADIDALALAIKHYDQLTTDLPMLKAQLRGAGDKGRSGLFVAKSIADYKRDMRQDLAAAVAFARANNITYAPEVNTLLAP